MKKKLLSLILCLVMLLACIPVSASEFNDVKEGEWYYEAVIYCKDRKIFNGTGNGNFSPLRTLSRAEFVTAIANYSGIDVSAFEYDGFTDVDPNAYYYHAMAWARNEGIVNGTSDTTFSPTKKITREQLCTMICRYLAYIGIDTNVSAFDKFEDDALISDWAVKEVYTAKALGLVQGVGANLFKPKLTSTRAQAAQIMMNLDKYCVENKKEGNEFMLDDAVVDIKIEGLTGNYKFLHVSDAHLTLTDDTDTPEAIADQKARGEAFDAQITDGVKKEDRLANAYKYAEAEGCEAVILTGDILDAPSNGNMAYLNKVTKESNVDSIYLLGNHDWTFSANYQSSEQRGENIPKFQEIYDKYYEDGEEDLWDEYVDSYEYDGFVIVTVDNSNDQIPNGAQATLEYYAKKNIPVILALHVPISVPTMVNDVSAMWGRDICIGASNLAPNIVTTKFINYLKSADSPVKAVLAGHIHMDHVDDLSPNNDTVQYTLGATYQGAARIFNIHG